MSESAEEIVARLEHWLDSYADGPDEADPADIHRLIGSWRERGEALLDVAAHLAAAISLHERGGKKAAASDKLFAQMLIDYRDSLERARAVLGTSEEEV